MDYWCRLVSLSNSYIASGSSETYFFVPVVYTFPYSHFSCYLLPRVFVLFHSCCSHEQVFGRTLVHEFPIFYSHTEWNLLSSFCRNGDKICKRSA